MCKLKALLLLSVILTTGCLVKAQTSDLDSRLVDFYGEEHLQKMDKTAPGTLEYLNYYVQHGYEIVENLSEKKIQQFENISTVKNLVLGEFLTQDDIKNLNILEIGIKRKEDQYLTYRIDNTNDVIVFIAPNELRRRFEQEGNR